LLPDTSAASTPELRTSAHRGGMTPGGRNGKLENFFLIRPEIPSIFGTRFSAPARTMGCMNSLYRAFTAHPASVGESYLQHMGSAFYFARVMLVSAAAVFLHGLFPFLFTKSGREAVIQLHERMVTHRARAPSAPMADDAGAR
jgi:hypothetical protein